MTAGQGWGSSWRAVSAAPHPTPHCRRAAAYGPCGHCGEEGGRPPCPLFYLCVHVLQILKAPVQGTGRQAQLCLLSCSHSALVLLGV